MCVVCSQCTGMYLSNLSTHVCFHICSMCAVCECSSMAAGTFRATSTVTWSLCLSFLLISREAPFPGDFPCQLSHRLPGPIPRSQWMQQWAVPTGDAHLYIPAAGPERVQWGLQELHRTGPDRAGHHGSSGAGRWVSATHRLLLLSTHPGHSPHPYAAAWLPFFPVSRRKIWVLGIGHQNSPLVPTLL